MNIFGKLFLLAEEIKRQNNKARREIVKMKEGKRCKFCHTLITKKDNLKTICNLCRQEIKEV